MRYVDADQVAALGPAAAVRAITAALRDGLDPAADPARVAVPLSHGQLLLMPAEASTSAGVKVVTVAPGNPERGLPRVQAAYLLLDPETLALRAVLDGTALTTLRTPAVSVAAVLPYLPERPLRLVVIGGGPQAHAHVRTLAAVRTLADTTYVARATPRAEADAALAAADVVVCATTARTPLFDSAVLGDDAVVVAVGSHEPDARELDAALLGRAQVVVEDPATAMREAGDVVLAVTEGALDPAALVPMADVVTGRAARSAGRPLVFKSVGMAWEDLVVADAVLAALPAT